MDETDRLLQALEPVLGKYRDTRQRREAQAVLKAMRLAPSLEVCEALLRGQDVPRAAMDAMWVKAYRL